MGKWPRINGSHCGFCFEWAPATKYQSPRKSHGSWLIQNPRNLNEANHENLDVLEQG